MLVFIWGTNTLNKYQHDFQYRHFLYLDNKEKNIMDNEYQVPEHRKSNFFSVLVGMLIGSLAGAVTMLLLAPQSGEDTRSQIQEKGIELRDRTTAMVEDAMAQMRQDRNLLTIGGKRKAKELLQQGQTLVVEQLDRVSDAAQAGKKAIQSSSGL
jgi:gas vesicle protein